MKKDHLIANELEIAYLEINPGLSQTIFFIHSNSGSSDTWHRQYNSHVFINYRLVAIDLPGHGGSGPSPNPDKDYSLPALGEIVADAVKRLSADKPYILAGLSLASM